MIFSGCEMANSESNKQPQSHASNDLIEVSCFNCGNTVTMSVLKAESMDQMGQVVYCRECDENVDEDEDGNVGFVPFF